VGYELIQEQLYITFFSLKWDGADTRHGTGTVCHPPLLLLPGTGREMAVVLLCGYRGTGKDTLFTEWEQGRFPWKVYRSRLSEQLGFPIPLAPVRVAFADPLKQEVAEQYGVPIDAPKEEKLWRNEAGELVSARDLYIAWGAYRRSQDPNYWCKKGAELVMKAPGTAVVTDWRFVNEGMYFDERFPDLITVRLFRSAVPIPPEDIESEHQLDGATTDYLLVTSQEDFAAAVEQFPQYRDYILSSP
jgi:hypothetical protein